VGYALVQRPDLRSEHVKAGHALSLILGVALAVLMLLIANLVALPIFGASTADLVRLSAPLCIVTALGVVPIATLSRRMEFSRLSIQDVISTLMRVVVSISLAAAAVGARSLVFGTLAATVTLTVLAWWRAPPPLPRLRRRPARELLAYGLPASLASISWVAFRNCDYAIIGGRIGTLQAGFYFRAYQLGVEYQKKISLVLQQVAFPVLSRTETSRDRDELRGQMVRMLCVVLFPSLALLAAVAPVLVPWLLGNAWKPVVLPTQILVIGGAATMVIDAAGVVLMAAGRAKAMLAYGVGHFVCYATAVMIVVPYGLGAVAIAAAVVHSAFLIVAYVLMLPGGKPVRSLWNDIGPAIVSCMGLAAVALPVALLLNGTAVPAPVRLAAVAASATAGYLVTLHLAFPATSRELRSFISRLLPGSRRRGAGGRAPVPPEPPRRRFRAGKVLIALTALAGVFGLAFSIARYHGTTPAAARTADAPGLDVAVPARLTSVAAIPALVIPPPPPPKPVVHTPAPAVSGVAAAAPAVPAVTRSTPAPAPAPTPAPAVSHPAPTPAPAVSHPAPSPPASHGGGGSGGGGGGGGGGGQTFVSSG
jgi:O-antigen/teichoic acid export membrane protein